MKQKKLPSKNTYSVTLPSVLGMIAALLFFLSLTTEVTRYALHRGLWNDEVLSLWILRLPFREFLAAIYSGYDGMLPVFYLTSWPVVHLFSDVETAARWVQIIPALAAPVIFLIFVAKRFSPITAAVSVMPMVWFFAQYGNLSWHLRAYGFFLFATAAAIVLMDREPSKRGWWWVGGNALIQVMLVGSQPFGIFYCGLLGMARWLADWRESGIIAEKRLLLSYIPAGLVFISILPAIQAARKLVEPIPWQPATTIQTLQTVIFPSLSSGWALVALVLILLPLVLIPAVDTVRRSPTSHFLIFVPVALLSGTLAVWLYSLHTPLYLDRYFSPNVWAWCLILAWLYSRIESHAHPTARLLSSGALLFMGMTTAGSILGAGGSTRTHEIIQATHILLQGTRDNEILDANLPVLTSDLNVFMERLHYNPKNIDYRAVFSAVPAPPEPNRSYSERRLTEGMVALGMSPDRLLDPQEAVELVKKHGGATFLGVKRNSETVTVLETLKNEGYRVKSDTVNVAGAPLFLDRISTP